MKENIFSNFYAKVLSFFTSGKDESEATSSTASNRLKLVLMQDRSNLDGATLQKMREQLISVISKYIEIDTEALDLNLEGDGDEIALMLNIPVVRARTPEEIDELEAQEEKDKQEAIQKAVEEALNKEKEDSEAENQEEDDESEESENSEQNDNEEKEKEKEKEEEEIKAENKDTEEDKPKEKAEAEKEKTDEKETSDDNK